MFGSGEEFGRCERIRTSDPFLPKEVRYQAALHTDSREARYYTRARCLVNPGKLGQEQA